MRPIYLDYNATTPIAPQVAAAMKPFLESGWGNPSSSHWYGRQAREAIDRARGQVARLLGCEPDEIVFTAGGSESNNHAIRGAARARRDRGDHLITSAIEHPAVLQVCRWLEADGWKLTVLPVDENGLVRPDDLRAALRPETVLVSVMHANNEVGTVEPIAELAAIARAGGALFHTDAAQTVGKIPVRVDDLGVDLLSVAGHKLYAPKGVGVLYIRRDIALERLIHGADHEQGRRAGTENVLGIVGLGAAAELARKQGAAATDVARSNRDRLEAALLAALPGARVNGHPVLRLPNTLSLAMPGVQGATLVVAIEDRVACSAGSACHSGETRISGVLAAMGVPDDLARGTLRLSVGRGTSPKEIDRAVQVIVEAVGAA